MEHDPALTQHDLADITRLEELRKRYAPKAEAAGGGLTITAIAAKVVASALKLFPQFNVSIDLAADELIYKKYVNIGIAVDTDRGLLVPVIRDVDTKNIVQISVELVQLSEKARARKISLDEMQGGCFSISTGLIGCPSFTPIVNAPEVPVASPAPHGPFYDNPACSAPRSCCRCPCPTIIALSTARTAPSCAGSRKRSSSRSCWRSRADVLFIATKTRKHEKDLLGFKSLWTIGPRLWHVRAEARSPKPHAKERPPRDFVLSCFRGGI